MAATILCRMAGAICGYAVDAVKWASSTGLLQGSDGYLMPKAPTTRAQLAAILTRYSK